MLVLGLVPGTLFVCIASVIGDRKWLVGQVAHTAGF